MKTDSCLSAGERIAGGIYGALVGDALGVPVEFSDRSARDADPVAEMRAWGTWRQPAGTWSDDGALMLCTAEGLVSSYSPEEIGRLFVRWMKYSHWTARDSVFDIGGATLTALERIDSGVPAASSGMTEVDQNGNGSLMRILPVALRFAFSLSDYALVERAMEVSRITHAHPRSQLACAFYCLISARVLHGETIEEAYLHAIDRIEPALRKFESERKVFGRILSGRIPLLSRSEIKSSGYVVDTLEASLWCALNFTEFHTAVLEAVNLGGDTDTTGCVTGGLVGILHGRAAIPKLWIDSLPRLADLNALLNIFVPACRPSP
jgi:ADP-ribosyl-[dinitrogen reductase] hydrolase